MRVLALETACPPGSLAAADSSGSEPQLRSVQLTPEQKTTQAFSTEMVQLLQQMGWQRNEVQCVALTSGPGSFTGLRIGVTAAKVYAYATQCQILAVNTLEVIARQCPVDGTLTTVLDAQRGELFTARFRKSAGKLEWLEETRIQDAEAWLQALPAGELISGLGLRKWRDQLPEQAQVVDEQFWRPQAATLARLALEYMDPQTKQLPDQLAADAWQLVPEYFRKSAAEEKAGL